MSSRILLVEDDAEIADFVVRGLREDGFVVAWAADGLDGWKRLQSSSWDIVLLDWWLPKVDGLTLLKRFRESGQTTPVLFLTARDAIADRVQGLECGADDYLCKPFAFDELLARVRSAIRRACLGQNALLSFQDVRLDRVQHQAFRSGQRLDLTAKEEALLCFFLRHPEEVLSRPLLYEQVWEEAYDGESNTLEVHVMELRRKLEAHGPRLIHTLRNRGYLFGDEPR